MSILGKCNDEVSKDSNHKIFFYHNTSILIFKERFPNWIAPQSGFKLDERLFCKHCRLRVYLRAPGRSHGERSEGAFIKIPLTETQIEKREEKVIDENG